MDFTHPIRILILFYIFCGGTGVSIYSRRKDKILSIKYRLVSHGCLSRSVEIECNKSETSKAWKITNATMPWCSHFRFGADDLRITLFPTRLSFIFAFSNTCGHKEGCLISLCSFHQKLLTNGDTSSREFVDPPGEFEKRSKQCTFRDFLKIDLIVYF